MEFRDLLGKMKYSYKIAYNGGWAFVMQIDEICSEKKSLNDILFRGKQGKRA